MHNIEAVLFDYGMVLSGPPLPSAWERMKSVTGLNEPHFHAGYWEYRHGYDRGTHSGIEYWHLVAGHSGVTLTAEQAALLIATDTDLWTELNPPMVAWAQRLQRSGVRTGILSNLGDEMNAGLLAKFDWLAAFDHCTWSHRLKIAKPELEIYQYAVSGLNTPAERILFIDDRADNIAGAQAAGLQTMRYTTHDAFELEMVERGFESLLNAGKPTDARGHESVVHSTDVSS